MPDETRFIAVNPVIPVRDMDQALRFDEEQLGFRKVFDDASGPGARIAYAAAGSVCTSRRWHRTKIRRCRSFASTSRTSSRSTNRAAPRVSSPPGGRLGSKPWETKEFGLYDLNQAALVFYEDLAPAPA